MHHFQFPEGKEFLRKTELPKSISWANVLLKVWAQNHAISGLHWANIRK